MIKLPEELRKTLKKPFGRLYRGSKEAIKNIKEDFKDRRIIVVGDVTLKNVLDENIKPYMAIIDLKTKRNIRFEKNIESYFKNILNVKNEPSTVSEELMQAVERGFKEGNTLIIVDGEEDLAVIPCVLFADEGDVVLYGQPDEGIVAVEVNDEKKVEVATLVKIMRALGGG